MHPKGERNMDLDNLQVKHVAKMIDNTVLKPFISNDDWLDICQKSMTYGFKTVAINNAGIAFCKKALEGSDVLVDAAVSFPLGQCTLETKCFETLDAIKKGAGEVDYVINIVELKNKNHDYIKKEMASIVDICRQHQVVSKVIFETCYLTKEEIVQLCQIANDMKPDFIKTSTGFGEYGARIEDVTIMRQYADEGIQIKASGGIRSLREFMAFLEAGATRIGTSSGVKIVKEYQQLKHNL